MPASRPTCRPSGLAAALVPLAAGVLGAQPPAAAARVARAAGTVTGAVWDSLARAPLAGAEVQLVPDAGAAGRAFSVRTDAEGRFHVDSVPAGRYLAGFLHPRVDSLGVGIAPVALTLGDDTARVDLAFPSATSVQRQLCDPSEVSDSTALLVGVVRDAATGAPRRDATVRLRWTELELAPSGVRFYRPEIAVRTRGDGWFGVCGVPTSDRDDIGLAAESGADTSGVVPLRMGDTGVARRDLYVGRGLAPLRGVVRAASGNPVGGARVQLVGGTTVTTTDRDGAFVLAGQPVGSRLLDVRALGHVPLQLAVDLLGTGAPNAVAVTLTNVRSYLDTIRVTERRIDRTGFERRRRTLLMGRFLTPDDIAKRTAILTTDLLSGIGGVRLTVNQFGQRQVLMRGGFGGTCRPDIYIDGMPLLFGMDTAWASTNELDLFTRPDRLAGVEIYRDVSIAPVQFKRDPLSQCGSIVVWTTPRLPKAPRAKQAGS